MEISNLFVRDLELVAPAFKNLCSALSSYKLCYRSAELRFNRLWEENKGSKMSPYNEESYWRGKVYDEVRDIEKRLHEAYRTAQKQCNEVGITLSFTFEELKYWVEHPAEDEWITKFSTI